MKHAPQWCKAKQIWYDGGSVLFTFTQSRKSERWNRDEQQIPDEDGWATITAPSSCQIRMRWSLLRGVLNPLRWQMWRVSCDLEITYQITQFIKVSIVLTSKHKISAKLVYIEPKRNKSWTFFQLYRNLVFCLIRRALLFCVAGHIQIHYLITFTFLMWILQTVRKCSYKTIKKWSNQHLNVIYLRGWIINTFPS